MSTTQQEDDLQAEIARITRYLEKLGELFENEKPTDAYAALTYALGRLISTSHDPAGLLCETVPRLAYAAKITCRLLGNLDDLEELLADDQSQSTH